VKNFILDKSAGQDDQDSESDEERANGSLDCKSTGVNENDLLSFGGTTTSATIKQQKIAE